MSDLVERVAEVIREAEPQAGAADDFLYYGPMAEAAITATLEAMCSKANGEGGNWANYDVAEWIDNFARANGIELKGEKECKYEDGWWQGFFACLLLFTGRYSEYARERDALFAKRK